MKRPENWKLVALIAVIVVLASAFALEGVGGLIIVGGLFLLFAFVGVVPFALGFLLQSLMRDRDLPLVAMLLAAASLLVVPLLTGRDPEFAPAISRILGFVVTLLVNFWFVSMGVSAGVAFRRWRTEKNRVAHARSEA